MHIDECPVPVIHRLTIFYFTSLYSTLFHLMLLGEQNLICTRSPVTSCPYTIKNPVPAVVHTQKAGDLTLSKKKKLLPGGGVPTVMSDTV